MRAMFLALALGTSALLPACGGGGRSPAPQDVRPDLADDAPATWVTTLGSSSAGAGLAATMDAYSDGSAVLVQALRSNGVYGLGETNERVYSVSPAAGAESVIVRYDTEGRVVWSRNLTGPGDDDVTDVVALPDGGVAIAGLFAQNLLVGGPDGLSEGLSAPEGEKATFAMRFASDGTLLWLRSFATNAELVDPMIRYNPVHDTMLLATPYTQDFVVDAGLPTEIAFEALANKGWAILSLYDSGKPQWGRQITGSGTARVFDVRVTPSGDLALAGVFQERLYFDHRDQAAPSLFMEIEGLGEGWVAQLDGLMGSVLHHESLVRGVLALPQRIAVHADGSLSIVGMFVDQITVGVGHANQTTLQEIDEQPTGFLVGINALGRVRYARAHTHAEFDLAGSLVALPDGGCMMSVASSKPERFLAGLPAADGIHTPTPVDQFDSLLVTFDEKGLYVSHTAHDGPTGLAILELKRLPDGRLMALGLHEDGAGIEHRDGTRVPLASPPTTWLALLTPEGVL